MPPKSYVMQMLMNQMGGSTAPTTVSEPDFMSRDFRPMDFSNSPPSNMVPRHSGNPVMDLANQMYQGGVGDTRGTGGMQGSGSDPMNPVPPRQAVAPQPQPFGMETEGGGMPGSGSELGDFMSTPDFSVGSMIDRNMPNMGIRDTSSSMELPNVVGYDYPGIMPEPRTPMETSGSFNKVPNPTEQAYQASLPGMNRIQANAQTQMAMNRGDLDSSPMDIRKYSELSPYKEDLPQNILREQTQEAIVPQEMQPSMMYRAGEAAPGVADKTAKTVGLLGRGLAKMGGSALNSFLYGQNKKGLGENLNKTFYGGEKSLRENLFGLPPNQNKPVKTNKNIGPGIKGIGEVKQKGGFKGAFAAARKGNKKTFMYKGKKYTTALASDKKKGNDASSKTKNFFYGRR